MTDRSSNRRGGRTDQFGQKPFRTTAAPKSGIDERGQKPKNGQKPNEALIPVRPTAPKRPDQPAKK